MYFQDRIIMPSSGLSSRRLFDYRSRLGHHRLLLGFGWLDRFLLLLLVWLIDGEILERRRSRDCQSSSRLSGRHIVKVEARVLPKPPKKFRGRHA
jgi:hypothetical protein